MEPVLVKSKIEYWGKRAGGITLEKPVGKNHFTKFVRLGQWGVGATGAGPTGYKAKPARLHARAMALTAAQYRTRGKN